MQLSIHHHHLEDGICHDLADRRDADGRSSNVTAGDDESVRNAGED